MAVCMKKRYVDHKLKKGIPALCNVCNSNWQQNSRRSGDRQTHCSFLFENFPPPPLKPKRPPLLQYHHHHHHHQHHHSKSCPRSSYLVLGRRPAALPSGSSPGWSGSGHIRTSGASAWTMPSNLAREDRRGWSASPPPAAPSASSTG